MASVGHMERIRLEEWGQSKNGNGSLVDTRIRYYALYASVRRLRGARSVEQNQVKLSDTLEMGINTRLSLDVSATWKVVYKGRRHTVLSIDDDMTHDYVLTVESKGVPIDT